MKNKLSVLDNIVYW